MFGCLQLCAPLLDERTRARVNGAPCTWRTPKPTRGSPHYVLLLGLDNSGKTSIVDTLLRCQQGSIAGQPAIPAPTGVPQMTLISCLTEPVVAVDVPGQHSKRQCWQDALRFVDGVAFVIDACDELRLPVVQQELWQIMPSLVRRCLPLLVLITKCDARKACNLNDVVRAVGVSKACTCLPAPWLVRHCCSGEPAQVSAALDWLVGVLSDHRQLRPDEAKAKANQYQLANAAFSAELQLCT